jgi:hypothetical protein
VCYWPAVPAATAADVAALAAAAPLPAAPCAAAAPPPPPAIEVGLEAGSGHLVAIAVRGGTGAAGEAAAGSSGNPTTGNPNSAALPLDLRELDVEAALLRAAEANAALQLGAPVCAATRPGARGSPGRGAVRRPGVPAQPALRCPRALKGVFCTRSQPTALSGSRLSRRARQPLLQRADLRLAHLRVTACTPP